MQLLSDFLLEWISIAYVNTIDLAEFHTFYTLEFFLYSNLICNKPHGNKMQVSTV